MLCTQTKRNIDIMFKEYLRNVKHREDDKSPVVEHILNINHTINSVKLSKYVNNMHII